MASNIHTSSSVGDDGCYSFFKVTQHWDKEGIPFQVELTEQRDFPGHEHEVEIRIIPSALNDLIIWNQQGQVMFSLRNIRKWLEAEYDKKRNDELTEVEDE